MKHSQREKYQEMASLAAEKSEIKNLDESCKAIERENSMTPTKTLSSNKQKNEISATHVSKASRTFKPPGTFQANKTFETSTTHVCRRRQEYLKHQIHFKQSNI